MYVLAKLYTSKAKSKDDLTLVYNPRGFVTEMKLLPYFPFAQGLMYGQRFFTFVKQETDHLIYREDFLAIGGLVEQTERLAYGKEQNS